MKIVTRELEATMPERLTSGYISSVLEKAEMNVLHWAILDVSNNKLLLSVNVIED